MPKTAATYDWEFKPRFRKHAFGWRSDLAIKRVKEAVKEIQQVAKDNLALGAEGAVIFLERIGPAICQVDGSSGSMGNAVYSAIIELSPLIATAVVDATTRQKWLDRLWKAYDGGAGEDYLDQFGDSWGDFCGSEVVASGWANKVIDVVREAESGRHRDYCKATIPCLSALFKAQRYETLFELLELEGCNSWMYKIWGAKFTDLVLQKKRH